MKADLDYVEIALNAVADILSYVDESLQTLTEDTFLGNKMMRNAMLMHLVVIGEALSRVSTKTQHQFPSPTWREAKFARNFYVHQYDGIEWPTVYETVQAVVLPTLEMLEEVKQHLETEAPNATDQ